MRFPSWNRFTITYHKNRINIVNLIFRRRTIFLIGLVFPFASTFVFLVFYCSIFHIFFPDPLLLALVVLVYSFLFFLCQALSYWRFRVAKTGHFVIPSSKNFLQDKFLLLFFLQFFVPAKKWQIVLLTPTLNSYTNIVYNYWTNKVWFRLNITAAIRKVHWKGCTIFIRASNQVIRKFNKRA